MQLLLKRRLHVYFFKYLLNYSSFISLRLAGCCLKYFLANYLTPFHLSLFLSLTLSQGWVSHHSHIIHIIIIYFIFTLQKDKIILYCNAILSYQYYIVNFTVSLFLDFIEWPTITVGLILLYITERHFRSLPLAALLLGTPLYTCLTIGQNSNNFLITM